MPPSADDLPGKKPPERRLRRGEGRRPGKQPGAPGAYLAWREYPDTTEEVFPDGSCACGADLADAADLGVQVVAAANKAIRALIILARVVCGDETPLRVGPGPKTRKNTCR
jgi:transposase